MLGDHDSKVAFYTDVADSHGESHPSPEPWLHAMMRKQRESWDNAGTLYPNCCCADTHRQFQRKGQTYVLVTGGLAWLAWKVWKRRR